MGSRVGHGEHPSAQKSPCLIRDLQVETVLSDGRQRAQSDRTLSRRAIRADTRLVPQDICDSRAHRARAIPGACISFAIEASLFP